MGLFDLFSGNPGGYYDVGVQQGRFLRDNPDMLKYLLQQQQQQRDAAAIKSLMGAAPTKAKTEDFNTDLFPGEETIPGLKTIIQAATPGRGYLGGNMSTPELAMNLLAIPSTKDIGGDLLKAQVVQRSGQAPSTFETGVSGQPEMKQRMYFDSQGQIKSAGDPYRAFAPTVTSTFMEKLQALQNPNLRSMALEALRDQNVDVGTGQLNVATGQYVPKDITSSKAMEKIGADIGTRLGTHQENYAANQRLAESLDTTMVHLQNLAGRTGDWDTGLVGNALSYVWGLPQYDWKTAKDVIVSQLGIGKLEQMKAQTQTGASGLGQLNEKEMDLLIKHVGNLDQASSKDEVFEQIKNITGIIEKAKNKTLETMDRDRRWYEDNYKKYYLEPIYSKGAPTGGRTNMTPEQRRARIAELRKKQGL